MPGSEESVLASCSSMAVATSRTGRTIARSALRTPTPSTEQNELEELALDLADEADQPRRHATMRGVAFEVLDRVQTDLLADLLLQVPPGEFGNEDFVLERVYAERERVFLQGDQTACDFGDHWSGK